MTFSPILSTHSMGYGPSAGASSGFACLTDAALSSPTAGCAKAEAGDQTSHVSPAIPSLTAAHSAACARAARFGASRCRAAIEARQEVRKALHALLMAEVGQ